MTITLDSDVRAPEIRELSENARGLLHELGSTLAAAFGSAANPRCRRAVAGLAAHIDGELRARMRPPPTDSGICVLRGVLIDEQALGRTPPDWAAVDDATSRSLDLQLVLLARMLGVPFSWQGQQEGRLVNNVVPARGYETIQTGANSSIALSPHTEDAFHPQRSHLFLLGCIRNPDKVATTISSVRHVRISDDDRAILLHPTVPIFPDFTYGDPEQRKAADPIPILWHRPDGLCLRYDPDYTPWADAEPRFRDAYQRLTDELARVSVPVVLEPGDVAIVDNDIVVHGRVPFAARFDGTDRWLKRINIAVPDRQRPAAESTENGYGQQVDYLFSESR